MRSFERAGFRRFAGFASGCKCSTAVGVLHLLRRLSLYGLADTRVCRERFREWCEWWSTASLFVFVTIYDACDVCVTALFRLCKLL